MKFLRCKVCGKIVAMVNDCSSCPTKCCGEAMEEIPVNTQDGAHEKHVPVKMALMRNMSQSMK